MSRNGADRLPAELPFPDALGTFGWPVFQSLDAHRHVAGPGMAQLLFTYLPFMNRLFHSARVRAEAWLYIVAIGVFTFAVVEFVASIPRQPPDAALTHMTEVAVYDSKPYDRELRYWGRNSPRLTASGGKKA